MDRAGQARILINHFPAWRARVNGAPAPVSLADDGYMAVSVPAGDVTVELEYTVLPVVWFARGLVTLGLLILIALLAHSRELAVGSRK